MMNRLLSACALAGAVCCVSPAWAGSNIGARATLSFRSDSLVTTPPTPTPTILKVYVWIEGARRVLGAEYSVRWHTAGGDSALTVLGEKHPSGAECGEYLLRGHSIGIPRDITPNTWGVAFASDDPDTTCTSGPISEILFDASALSGRPAVIELCDAGLLDDGNDEDHIAVQGDVRVNAGADQLPLPCGSPVLHTLTPRAASPIGGGAAVLTGMRLTGVTDVRVGGVPASNVRVLDDTHVSFTMPPRTLGVADVRATLADGRSGWLVQGAVYTNAPAPTITAVLPDTVVMGTPVTIQGTGFVGRMNVRIGGMLSPRVHVISSTLLTADVPTRRVGNAGIRLEMPDGQTFDWPGTVHLLASAP